MTKNKSITVRSFQPDGYVGSEKISGFYPEYFNEFSTKTIGFEVCNNRGKVICQLWPRLGEEY